MELTIKNNEKLDAWLNDCMLKGQDTYGIIGDEPKGATYDDGVTIVNKVNIGFRNAVTNEVFLIEY